MATVFTSALLSRVCGAVSSVAIRATGANAACLRFIGALARKPGASTFCTDASGRSAVAIALVAVCSDAAIRGTNTRRIATVVRGASSAKAALVSLASIVGSAVITIALIARRTDTAVDASASASVTAAIAVGADAGRGLAIQAVALVAGGPNAARALSLASWIAVFVLTAPRTITAISAVGLATIIATASVSSASFSDAGA
mmetsp:Transcript_28055/g.57469  ORF Transcript_28055/g.57469 Transcript_28055/m.57469 type:complete len:202 (-) Transcript_28055:2406-3011(-)